MKLIIYGNPVTKKNSMRLFVRNGRAGCLPSRYYEAYKQRFIEQIPRHWNTFRCAVPVNIRTVYYMETRRKVDLVNLQEATLDLLVAAGVLRDDNRDIVAGMDGSAVYWDKHMPRVEITITPVDGYEVWHA